MKLSRQQFWLFIQACVITIALLYQTMWLFAKPTTGTVVGIDFGTRGSPTKYALVEYEAGDYLFSDFFLVDEDFSRYHTGQKLNMHYLPFAKASARVDGITAGSVIWLMVYGIFMLLTAAIFIMPNYLIEPKSCFLISKQFPFIRYLIIEKRKRGATLNLIKKSNLFAGYIEKFMLPFAASLPIALIMYLITWRGEWVIISILVGSVFGVLRARKWKKQLKPDDPQLGVLDEQPGWTDPDPYS